jgi:uridine phosphorylase
MQFNEESSTNRIGESELILNPNGSVYHLALKPENIADDGLVVGDQGRVDEIAKYFDEIEFNVQNREFKTVTGTYRNKRFTVLSTGIGIDNIDIVLNELDAAVNIDLTKRVPKSEHRSLRIIRLGTSGALQEGILIGSLLVTDAVLGLDGLLNFYKCSSSPRELELEDAFIKHMKWSDKLARPYARFGSRDLTEKLAVGNLKGYTITAPGFYAPQGRNVRLGIWDPGFHDHLRSFDFKGEKITNFEMETSALYGLSKALGHKVCTVCTIIANRATKEFAEDYHPLVDRMITDVLNKLTH